MWPTATRFLAYRRKILPPPPSNRSEWPPLRPFCFESKSSVRLRGPPATAHAASARRLEGEDPVKRPEQVCESCWRVSRASSVPVTEIACHHNKVLATWHADTDEWTYQHRVARKRPTQKQSDQLAQMFDQASAATRRRNEP